MRTPPTLGSSDRTRGRSGARGQRRPQRHLRRARRAAPTANSMATTIRLATPAFDAKVKLLESIDAYARGKDPRVRQVTASVAASWQVVEILRADGETYRDIRPLVRAQRFRGRRRRRPAGIRQLRLWRPRRLSALHRAARLAGRGRRSRPPGAGQSRGRAGAGRRNGCRARLRLAGRDAARSRRPWPRRRLQSQEDLCLRRPDGPAGRGQGRHRRRRRHHAGSGAAHCRSTTKARRPIAPC